MLGDKTIALASLSLVPLLLVLAGLAWRKRDEPAGRAATLYHLLLAIAAAVFCVNILVRDPMAKFALTGLFFVLISSFTVTWVAVAFTYTGYRDWLTGRIVGALAVEPAVLTVVFAVPSLRPLVATVPDTRGLGSLLDIGSQPGPLMLAHFVYLFVLLLVATGLFLNLFVRSRRLNRGQAVALFGAAMSPWITILAQAFQVTSTDLSVFTWTLAGIAITVGLYRIKLLDPVPVGRAAAMEELADGVFVLDEDHRIADSNPAVERFFGFDTAEVRGRPVTDVVPDWDRIRDGGAAWTELTVTVDSDRQYFEAQTEPFTDHLDRTVGHLVVVRDVTARKRREQTLARYKTVFETVQDRVYVLDSDGRFLLVNEPLATLLGRDRESLVGEPFESVVADAPDAFDPVGGTTVTDPVELRVRTADGEEPPVETRLSPIEFEDVQGVVGYLRDISRRKQTERSLAETSGRLDTLVRASPLAIVGTDIEGRVQTWNPAAAEMFGYTESEVLDREPRIIPDSEREFIEARFDRVLDGERFTDLETRLECKDGTVIDASVSVAPQFDPAGDIQGTVSIIADVTERKERERRLNRQNERLDQFAGIVSHDLRNPLNVAMLRLELLESEVDSEHVEIIDDALDRMETLIEDTLTLARGGQTVGEMEQVELGPLVDQSWGRIEPEELSATLEADVPILVEADPDRLEQVLENLFRNSVEHGSTSPDLEAGGEQLQSGDESVTVRVGVLDGRGFYVEDDGPGIPAEERDEVFDAGVTSDRDGTGFGLAIVREIVEAHGWEIAVTEGSDGGARFEITGVEIGE